jgi:hypothetical protein
MLKLLTTIGTLFSLYFTVQAQSYTHSIRTNSYSHLAGNLRKYKDSSEVLDTIYKTTFQIPYFGKAISDSVIIWGNGNVAITEFEFDDEASAFGAELAPRKDGRSFIAQTTEGSSPNRIFKIEWGNMGFVYDTLGNDSVNFQVWFYEKDGIIEFHYGPSSVKNPFSWNSEIGPYVYLVDYNGENTYGLKGNPASPVSYTSFITGAGPLSSTPAENSVFRFTPASGNSVSDLSVSRAIIYDKGSGIFEMHTASSLISFTVYNVEGKKCMQGNTEQFSLFHLPAGIYLLHIETAHGMETVKLIHR